MVEAFDVTALQHRRYWSEQLAEAEAEAGLPLDRARPPRRTPRPASFQVPLPAELIAALDRLSRGTAGLRFAALFAALALTLRRYGAPSGVVIGVAALRRDGDDAANALPVLLHVDEEENFRALLQAARVALDGAARHDAYSGARLIDDLGRAAIADRGPLFAVAVSDVQLHGPLADLGQDVSLELSAGARAVTLEINYDRRLMDEATVARFARHLLALLDAGLADHGCPMAGLPMLDAEDPVALVGPVTGPVPDMVAQVLVQAARTPEAVAVEGDEALTYAELARRSSQMANWLRARGAGAQTAIALCLERGAEQLVAVLAILRLGAVVLPLDPDYPARRLQAMLDDSGAALLLARRAQDAARALARQGPACAWLEDFEPDSAADGATTPAAPIASATDQADPAQLAYLLYTSGSTGRPKGVAMTRGALSNLVAWQLAAEPGSRRTLQFASLNFDVSFQEIFVTWASGGTLFTIAERLRRDRAALAARIAEAGIERLFLPVVALRELAAAVTEGAPAPTALREIIVAGEQLQLTAEIVALLRAAGDCRLANHYGPTETHVATAATLDGPPTRWPPLPPIGAPVANCRAYLLDRHLRPVPSGAPGELYLAGACLARGYLGRPAATAERFLADPFAAEPGARMYRTGDLARRRADGALDFLGRGDRQLKIRGYRVEPGEVEAALGEHPEIAAAVVLADPRAPASRLLAYVVPAGASPPEPAALGEFLAARLPAFMLPGLYLPIDAPPLTPSGKIDRKALAERALAPPPAQPQTVAPRTETEAALAEIWRDILQLPKLGVTDDFFALGGHSLLVAQVAARVRRQFGFDMPVHLMFEAATIAELAARIDAAPAADPELEALAQEMRGLSAEDIARLMTPGQGDHDVLG